MMLKTHKFARKPFYVDAVRVSETNIDEVAEWCGGTVVPEHEEGKHVSVEVHRPMNERQTMAFIGDWVLFAGSGYKVYTPKAFDKSFEKVKTLTKAQADEAGITVPHEPRPKKKHQRPVPTPPVNPVLSKEQAAKIDTSEEPKKVEDIPEVDPAETKVIRDMEIHSVSLDKEVGPGGGKIESVDGKKYEPPTPPRSAQEAEADKLIADAMRDPIFDEKNKQHQSRD